MPIIDPNLGILIEDGKPDRLCAWRLCPYHGDSPPPEGSMMKACGRCKLIRYCSKECQVADWPEHKTVCRNPQALDINGWISAHEPGFRWTAAQALGGFSGANRISTHGLIITVLRADRLAAQSTAGAFVMLSAKVLPLKKMIPGHMPRRYHEECAELRRNGGLGCASVTFAVQGMPGGTTVMLFRRWELRRPAPAAAARGFFPHWEEVAKNAANEKIYDAELLHSINNWELPADVGSEVIQEVD